MREREREKGRVKGLGQAVGYEWNFGGLGLGDQGLRIRFWSSGFGA